MWRAPPGPADAQGPTAAVALMARAALSQASRGAWGMPQKTLQSPDRLYKASTDNTKPQQTIQNGKILDKTLQY